MTSARAWLFVSVGLSTVATACGGKSAAVREDGERNSGGTSAGAGAPPAGGAGGASGTSGTSAGGGAPSGAGGLTSVSGGRGGGSGSGVGGASAGRGTDGAGEGTGAAGSAAIGGGSAQSGDGGSGGVGTAGSVAVQGGEGGAAGVEDSCHDVTPCGGDPVGAWTVIDSCLTVSGVMDLESIGIDCRTARVMGSLRVSGTWTASALNMGILDDTVTSGTEEFEFPAGCLMISGARVTCGAMANILGFVGYAPVTCEDAGGGCRCMATVDQVGGIASVSPVPTRDGTYTTANNVLTTSNDYGNTQYAYCVSGRTLTLVPKGTETGTVTGSVVLQKQ